MAAWSEQHNYGISIIPELVDRIVEQFNDIPDYDDLVVYWDMVDENNFVISAERPDLTEEDFAWVKDVFGEFERVEVEKSCFNKASYDRGTKCYYPESITVCFKIV